MFRALTVVLLLLVLVCGGRCLPRSMGQVQAGQQNARITPPAVETTHLRSPWTVDESQNAGPKGRDQNDPQIFFPDSLPASLPAPRPTAASKLKSKCTTTYCTEAEDYPSDYVSNLLSKTRIQYRSVLEDIPVEGLLTNRLDPSDGEPLCRSKEEVITPQKALNKDSEWKFILQDTKTGEFVQSVRIETCHPGFGGKADGESPCHYTHGFPEEFTTSCKQKYIYKKLLAIPANGTKADPALDNFQIPSCCSCSVKKTGSSFRFGQVPNRGTAAAALTPKIPSRRPPPATVASKPSGGKGIDAKNTPILFPDDIPPSNSNSKNKCTETFCTETEDYPSEYVNTLLSKTRIEYRSLFEEIPFEDLLPDRSDFDDESLCASKEEIIKPSKALNKDSQWMFILQDTKTGEFVQSVRIETCLPRNDAGDEEATSCKYAHVFPLGYRTSCKQKFIYKKLLAIPTNDSKAEPTLETFRIPSCCSCTVKESPGTITRFLDDLPPKQSPAKTSRP